MNLKKLKTNASVVDISTSDQFTTRKSSVMKEPKKPPELKSKIIQYKPQLKPKHSFISNAKPPLRTSSSTQLDQSKLKT